MQPTTNQIVDVAPVPPPVAPPPTETAVQRAPVTLEALALFPDSEMRNRWINGVVEADIARRNYSQDLAMAQKFAESGQFDDLKQLTAQQAVATAMVKINLGRGWGMTAADSMRYIFFTNGKPSIENEIVAAKLQQAGIDWSIEWVETEVQHKGQKVAKCVGCRLWLKRWHAGEHCYQPILDIHGEPVAVAFTEYDADTAKIWEKGKQIPLSEKWNFVSWARDMYFWRCIGRVKKYHAPHVLRGGTTFEERLDVVSLEGPPSLMPPDLAAPGAAAEPQAEPKLLRDKILAGEVGPQEFKLESEPGPPKE